MAAQSSESPCSIPCSAKRGSPTTRLKGRERASCIRSSNLGLNGDATKLRFPRRERSNVGRRNYANLELDTEFANLRAGLFARLIKVSQLFRVGSRCFVHLQITFAISHRSALKRFRLMRLVLYLKVARNGNANIFVSRGKRRGA